VNRRDLVQAVSTQTGVERRQVDSVLLGFTQVVTAVVSKGEPVSISGFAKFVKVDRPARMGRNPQTQEPVRIKASKKARITPLKGFKDAVVKTSLAPKLDRGVWPPAPAAAKKSTAKKSTAKKSTAKKSTGAAKAGARKSTAKRSTAKRSTAKKSTTKRATTRKAPARKTTARKTTARKTTARKTPARKTTARKTTARKTTARKTTKR
jgi:DNA-binding protein HU-beta